MAKDSITKPALWVASLPLLGLALALILHFQPPTLSLVHSAFDYAGSLGLVAMLAFILKLVHHEAELAVDQKRKLEVEVQTRTMQLERREAEYRKLALIASRTDNAAIITDSNGRVEWVNDSFTRITGYTLSEAVGRTPGSLLQGPDTDPGEKARIRACIARAEAFEAEVVNYAKDGRRYWVHISAQPIHDLAGRLTNFIALERDISEQRRAAGVLLLAKENAEAASSAKTEFLANMSHELRTPLTSILGYSDLLIGDPRVPADLSAGAQTIRRSGEHLLGLVSDVMDISKIESGHMTTERVDCSPVAIVREVELLVRERAAARGLSLVVEFQPPIPARVFTDPTRLKQILINLVGNAVKFTTAGAVRVQVALTDGARPRLAVSVEDTGIGIEPSCLERLFTPFTQGDASTSRRFGGTGLGLAISRRLAHLLGGDVTATSAPGQGSRFEVTIDPGDLAGVPMLQEPQAGAPASMPIMGGAPSSPRTLTGLRLLVAEDGPDNQRLIKHLLERAGAEVDAAADGARAVEMALVAEAAPRPYAMVLMDMQMPEMDGYAATRALRVAGFTRPILALTAHALTGDRGKCLEAGCNDYLTKPIDRAKLIEACAKWGRGAAGGPSRREAA